MDGVAVLMGFLAAYAVVVIIFYILQVVAYWKIFTKAGEAGWKSLVPVYNTYVQYRLTWEAKYFWIALALAVVGGLLKAVGGIVGAVGSLAVLGAGIMNIVGFYKLACAFGHGAGFTVGLIFLNPIFMLILGLGKSEYQGQQ